MIISQAMNITLDSKKLEQRRKGGRDHRHKRVQSIDFPYTQEETFSINRCYVRGILFTLFWI